MPAEKPFVTKDFGSALQISRVSFAQGELLLSLLSTPHGAVTPLSVINDGDNKIEMIIDSEIIIREKIVITDGTLHGYLCISTKDLIEKYLPSVNHSPLIIDL